MKKRSNSRGTPTGGEVASSSGDQNVASTKYKSGASSAPATPTKRSGSNNGGKNGNNKHKEEIAQTFVIVNERPVDDISLDFFYKPHTITLLAVSVLAVMYTAFVRNEANLDDNLWAGLLCIVFFFLIVSVIAFPNGPFTRPHPAVWRILFGCSVLYLLTLQFLMFQNYSTIRNIFYWLDPKLKNFHIDMEKEYGVNCSDISWDRVKGHLDVFAWGHFLGWAFKAILIRHMGILWAISVMWEITEITFAHLLPNFIECWWDALILDVIICNGLGIWMGLKICKILEMREYKWASIKDISTTTGKIKRAMLQFTPESWSAIRWLDPKSTAMRFAAVIQLVIFWQVTELNTFFLKHIFEMPPDHFIVIGRLIFIGLFVAPSVRQYYVYVTDTRCKRVGTQCWVYGAIMVSEAILCIKNGKELFERTQAINIVLWLTVQVLISVAFVYVAVLWQQRQLKKASTPTKKQGDSAANSPTKESWIELSNTAAMAGIKSPDRITPLPFSNGEEYLRLLREAQRESNQSSRVVSLASSRRDTPRDSPKSPPNSPQSEQCPDDELRNVYINYWTKGGDKHNTDNGDWLQNWNRGIEEQPPKDWKFERSSDNDEDEKKKTTGYSIRLKRLGANSLFSREILYSLLVTNVLSLLLGAGFGLWLSKRGILLTRVVID